jgi:DNA-binding beta-propeller fold protein YncE
VANDVDSTVSVIRGRTNTVFATIHLPGHAIPEGLATDSETDTIYAADKGSDTVSAIAVCPK